MRESKHHIKLAITGKGGAGKTTVAILIAKYLASKGKEVILIDADPDANAALALGLNGSLQPAPISELKELIQERTGADQGSGQFFTINPKVDDIPERYAVDVGGVKLLRMGTLQKGGSGCLCPENAFLKALLAHLTFEREQVVILDMHAGIEHLGRGTARGVDMMMVVVEPGKRSIQTAFTVNKLRTDIGVRNLGVVINKYTSDRELALLEEQVAPLPVVGRIPFDPLIAASDLEGVCPYRGTAEQQRWAEEILSRIPAPA